MSESKRNSQPHAPLTAESIKLKEKLKVWLTVYWKLIWPHSSFVMSYGSCCEGNGIMTHHMDWLTGSGKETELGPFLVLFYSR